MSFLLLICAPNSLFYLELLIVMTEPWYLSPLMYLKIIDIFLGLSLFDFFKQDENSISKFLIQWKPPQCCFQQLKTWCHLHFQRYQINHVGKCWIRVVLKLNPAECQRRFIPKYYKTIQLLFSFYDLVDNRLSFLGRKVTYTCKFRNSLWLSNHNFW